MKATTVLGRVLLLNVLVRPLIHHGRLTLITSDGTRRQFGDGVGPAITVRFTTARFDIPIAFNPRLALGEAFMEGALIVEEGDIYQFLELLTLNQYRAHPAVLRLVDAVSYLARRSMQRNDKKRATRHVAHHYNLSNALYALFLDEDWQYSCAYFRSPDETLEQAQLNKKRHLAAKLLLQPGLRVLDIGCGWGGLALTLAREANVDVLGVTLSDEQLKIARERAAAAGLEHRVQFELMDYRQLTGKFDRIVSVGMFEHVGVPYYDDFFAQIHRLLSTDGVAVVHSIGRSEGPSTTNAWFRKYIFPGGYSPALSEVIPVVEQSGLWVTDLEILRLHYAMTIAEWRRRFRAAKAEVTTLYDERFYRMWEFYLAGAELSFRSQGHMNWQMQLTKNIHAVPLTRDYIYEWENGAEAYVAGVG